MPRGQRLKLRPTRVPFAVGLRSRARSSTATESPRADKIGASSDHRPPPAMTTSKSIRADESAASNGGGAVGRGGRSDPTLNVGDDRSEGFQTYGTASRCRASTTRIPRRSCASFMRVLSGCWGTRPFLCRQPKVGIGLAVSLTYEKGTLVRAVTRGNGVEGDDVTANTLTIRSLPRRLCRVWPSL